jgi:hypothetical protein
MNQSLYEKLKPSLENLILESKTSLSNVKRIAVAEAWKILQLTVAKVVQLIENTAKDLSGKDKKALAMEILSRFYDGVFTIVDIPFVPSGLEFIIHNRVKAFLMILLGSTIDAMVATFKQTGIFSKSQDKEEDKKI